MPGRNRWNRFIYRLWAPVYDTLVNLPILARARSEAMDLLALQEGERICLIGVGTGADFPFLPEGSSTVGIDLSEAMLAQARRKLPLPDREVTLQQGDAERLPFADESFDVAVLTLILSVVPDGSAAFREAVRIVRPGGRLLVFDKFVAPAGKPSLRRRILGAFIRPFGTDILRSFEAMKTGLPVKILEDRASLFRGAYRAIRLEKLPG